MYGAQFDSGPGGLDALAAAVEQGQAQGESQVAMEDAAESAAPAEESPMVDDDASPHGSWSIDVATLKPEQLAVARSIKPGCVHWNTKDMRLDKSED